MADTLTTDPASKAVTLSELRHLVCMEAAREIDALCRTLPGLVHVEDDHELHLVVRGIAARILRLSNTLGAGLFDEAVSVEELSRRVFLGGGGG